MTKAPPPPPLADSAEDAVRRALGALLVDNDVAAAHALERGPLDVTRRGRRERLGVALPDEVFTALRALGAGQRALELHVDGHRVRALPTAGDKVLLYLEKRPTLDARLSALVEEGVVPPDAAVAVLATARAGHGLVVVGSAGVGARRLACAVAREVAESAPVFSLDDGLAADWLLPAPISSEDANEDVRARARRCVAAGAEVLFSLGLSLEDARALAGAELAVSVIAVVAAPNAPAYYAALNRGPEGGALNPDALATQLCVVGRAPFGRPVLVEQHAPESAAPLAAAPVVEEGFGARPGRVVEASEIVPVTMPAPSAPSPPRGIATPIADGDLPPLPPLGAPPPAAWASSSLDDDPGWELGEARGAAASAFAGVMAEVKTRPSFTPRPPPVHPQTRALRGDPFGGLTLEPPIAESYGHDDGDGDGDGDGGSGPKVAKPEDEDER